MFDFYFTPKKQQRELVNAPGVYSAKLARIGFKYKQDVPTIYFCFELENNKVFFYNLKFDKDGKEDVAKKLRIIEELVFFAPRESVLRTIKEANSVEELASGLEILRRNSQSANEIRKLKLVSYNYKGSEYITINAFKPPFYV
jgi:hypothetical protein